MSESDVNVLIAQLAVTVAKSDGSISSTEAREIKKWVDDATEFTEEDPDEIRRDMNRAMQQAYSRDRSLAMISSDLLAIASKEDLYKAIQLCCKVMFADGIVEKNEFDIINELERLLGLSRKEVRHRIDALLFTLDANAFEGLTDEEIIGVDPSETNEEKYKSIIAQYGRWNAKGAAEQDREKLANINALKERCARLLEKYKT